MCSTLKEKYEPYFRIGAAVSVRTLETRKELIQSQFNSITCENEMKYSSLCPHQGRYEFGPADRIWQFAKENQIPVHGHTFVWHNQTPDDIFEETDAQQLLETLRLHVRMVRARYGCFETLDAVNEAIEDKTELYLRDTKWRRILGDNYIPTVFQLIHEEMPETKLFYNDYNEFAPEKREKILRLLKEMIAQGVPVYGMGMQSHMSIYSPDFDKIRRSIEAYAGLGLKLRISELDLSVYRDANEKQISMPNPEYDKLLAEHYRKLFAIYREYHKEIDAVTFWGVCDNDSWLNGFPVRGRRNYPLLFDDNGRAKEAYYSVMDF